MKWIHYAMLAWPGFLQADRAGPQEPAALAPPEIRVYLWDSAFRPIDPRDVPASLHVRAPEVLNRTLPMQFTHPRPGDTLPEDHAHAVRPVRGTPGWWAEVVLIGPPATPAGPPDAAAPEGWPARHGHTAPYLRSELDPLDLSGAAEMTASVVFRIKGEGRLAPGFRFALGERSAP